MSKATKLKLAAAHAAQAHEKATGHYSYAYHCGVLESSIDTLCAELAEYEPPATGKSERECDYEVDAGTLTVQYDIDEDGVTVNSVYANGMDIYSLLDVTTLDQIREHCEEVAEAEYEDSKTEAAISNWESRRDAMGAL